MFSIIVTTVLLIVVMGVLFNDFNYKKTDKADINSICVVESISYKLDGSKTVILRDKNYGRIIWYPGIEEVNLSTGASIEVTGVIKIPDPIRNPGQFDFRDYLKKQGISYVLSADGYSYISSSYIGHKITQFEYFFFSIKNMIYATFKSEKELCASVFFGDSSLIDNFTRSEFKRAGCSHILAVSGTHFSGFLASVPFIFERLNIRNRKSMILYILFCLLIGSLTGWTSSVTRASIMSIAAFSSRDSLSGLSLASIVIIVSNPYSVTSLGFLMSFSCSLAIRMFSRRISDKLSKVVTNNKLCDSVSVMLSSQIGIIPFWTSTGYYLSPYNFFVQMMVSSLAEAACTIFVPLIILSMLFSDWFSLPLVMIIKLIRTVVRTSECFQGIKVGSGNSGRILSYILFLLFLWILTKPGMLKRLFKSIFIFVSAITVGFILFDSIHGAHTTIVFIDVGQGDSCLVLSGGKSVLVDGGVYKEGEETIPDILDYYSIEKIDVAVMTHWDQDHAGGIAALYNAGRINKLCTSFVELNDDVAFFIENNFPDVDSPEEFLKSVELIETGDRIEVSKNCCLNCIWPLSTSDGGNEDSTVFILESDNFRCLLTGDIGAESEYSLIEDNLLLDCDVLKVSHHGSKYSTSRSLLEFIQAEYAVISVGKYNNYGHPHKETMKSLQEYGVRTYETRNRGAIIVSVFNDYWKISSCL